MSQRIEDYAFIGNMKASGLVGRDGSMDWLCLPNFDSAACFAALLGDARHGRWLLCPQAPEGSTNRRYRDGTPILETDFETADGAVTVIDFMPFPRNDDTVDVVRLIRGRRGAVPMRMELALRFDYGRLVGDVRRREYGLRASAGPEAIQVHTPFDLQQGEGIAEARFTVAEGDVVPCVLTWAPSMAAEPPARDVGRALEDTQAWWREWCSHYSDRHEWREPVQRSLITLKALTDQASGGIVAAPTTSLPERIGGRANWDYRFCWLRDATFTLYALLGSGYGKEARAWRDWLVRAVAGRSSEMQVMYAMNGGRNLNEHTLPWLPGYEGSQPVRVGNGAFTQTQLDIYGEVVELLFQAHIRGLAQLNDVAELLKNLLEYLEHHWNEKGSGLWETRGRKHAFTTSRVMSWAAFQRGVRMAEHYGLKGPVGRWRRMRDTIHRHVCEQHFDAGRNSFVRHPGTRALDAALLLMPLVGFLPADDPRIRGTVDAIQRDLTVDGFIYRHHSEIEGGDDCDDQGAFLLCTLWLADCLTMMGRGDEAREVFERVLAVRNDVGLLSEEYDPLEKRLLGNFPQALSHIGIINTAHNLRSPYGPAFLRAEE